MNYLKLSTIELNDGSIVPVCEIEKPYENLGGYLSSIIYSTKTSAFKTALWASNKIESGELTKADGGSGEGYSIIVTKPNVFITSHFITDDPNDDITQEIPFEFFRLALSTWRTFITETEKGMMDNKE